MELHEVGEELHEGNLYCPDEIDSNSPLVSGYEGTSLL